MCVDPSVDVPGLDTSLIAGTQTNGDAPVDQRSVWTDRQIALTGRASDGVLELATEPLAGSNITTGVLDEWVG